jgi:uncharacterized protein (TIGR00299 family) protein
MSERRMLYIDPWMGVAGDMLMAALLDTDRRSGRLEGTLRETLAAMGFDPGIVRVTRETDKGLTCTAVQVREEDNAPLRHLADLVGILEGSTLSETVRERARAAFERLAWAEATVHGCSVDEIHFHEVGAVDTLVDVVGVFALIEAMGIDAVGVGTIPVGGGTIEIAHGRMAAPAPATTLLLEGFPVVGGPEMKELTTPTGALLVGELEAVPGPIPEMTVEGVGYGCGTMRFPSGPNVVRVLVGRPRDGSTMILHEGEDLVIELETNLDDISAEVVGYTCRRLMEVGALEVWTTAACMKKGRPGVVLHALAALADVDTLVSVLMAETGTLGVRRSAKRRSLAERGMVTVPVGESEVAVKWGRRDGDLISVAAEYDSAVAAAMASGLPVRSVMEKAVREARDLLDHSAVDGVKVGR